MRGFIISQHTPHPRMRQPNLNSWSLLRLRKTTSQQYGARRWLLLVVAVLVLFYVLTATWFARSMFVSSENDNPVEIPEGLKGENTIPKQERTETTVKQPPYDEDDVHIVFSTGCNLFQHWQAETLLHSHLAVGQKGKITRVVSGCDTEMEKREHGKFLTHPEGLADDAVPMEELAKSSHPNFRLHVTPSFPGAKVFPWINKPMGLNHWLQNANPPITESVIIIIDPDQFFLDKIVVDGSRSIKGGKLPYGEGGLLCSSGCRDQLLFGRNPVGVTDMLRPGFPIAQTYGLGGHFAKTFNKSAIAGPDSPIQVLGTREADQYYSVGPPLIMHLGDAKKIFPQWVKFMTPVYQQNPGDIIADMYAYSFAAAHYKLPHTMFDHYMISSPGAGGEGWPFVDQFGDWPCSDPNKFAKPPGAAIPTFLHVAQRYDSELAFMFHKGHVPPNILSCDLPLIITPPEDLINNAQTPHQRHKNYILCNAYKRINEAVLAWKKKFCNGEYNDRKEIMLEKKGQNCQKGTAGKTCWVFARWVGK